MKLPTIVFLLFSTLIYSQDCKNSFSSEYDKFEKKVKCELDHRIVLSTFKTDDGQSWIGDHIGISWSQNYNNNSKSSNKNGWNNLEYDDDAIILNIWSKIQIKDCFDFECWQFSDTYTKMNGYNYKDWNEYLLDKKSYLTGYSYVTFLSTNGDTNKVYIKYDDSGTHLILNDPKYLKTVENYTWLKKMISKVSDFIMQRMMNFWM